MKMIWLNDSLVLRSENKDEKQALAVVFLALENGESRAESPTNEEAKTTSPSTSEWFSRPIRNLAGVLP